MRSRRLQLTLIAVALVAASCAVRVVPNPMPDAQQRAAMAATCVQLWDEELGAALQGAGLEDCVVQTIAGRTADQWRAILRESADGQAHQAWVAAQAAEAARPKAPRLHVEGRRFVREDGSPFVWRGVTAFALPFLLAQGHEDQVAAYLDWCRDHDVTIVRVLTMAWNLFRLDPETGDAVMPRLLDMAAQRGLYVEVVALADTAAYTFDRAAHVTRLGQIAADHSNAVLELANEPVHQTQAAEVGDPAYLRKLRELVPPGVLVALGPAGATIAEDDTRFIGDWMPIHEERSDDGSGVRWVRHLADLREISARVNLPVVNDEPRRDDQAPDNQAGVGVLAKVFGLGDTYHYQGGLGALIPVGAELDGFEGRRAGWNAIPDTWTGSGAYCNAGFANCPVQGADWTTVVKVYGVTAGDDGYEVAIGVKGAPGIGWSDGWPNRTVILQQGRSWAWRVSR